MFLGPPEIHQDAPDLLLSPSEQKTCAESVAAVELVTEQPGAWATCLGSRGPGSSRVRFEKTVFPQGQEVALGPGAVFTPWMRAWAAVSVVWLAVDPHQAKSGTAWVFWPPKLVFNTGYSVDLP